MVQWINQIIFANKSAAITFIVKSPTRSATWSYSMLAGRQNTGEF